MKTPDAAFVYDPPTEQDDPRVCGGCKRAWGSVLVSHPGGYTIVNLRTGKYHSGRDYGMTDCGIDATGEAFLWPV